MDQFSDNLNYQKFLEKCSLSSFLQPAITFYFDDEKLSACTGYDSELRRPNIDFGKFRTSTLV